MDRQTVTVEGCKIAIRRAGRGQPLLLLHGANGYDWPEPMVSALAERFEVIAPEHPGFGASETPEWLRHIDDMAYFYLSFVEALKIQKANVLAFSFGGWIAAETAAKNSSAFGKMVLVAPAGLRKIGEPTGDFFIWNRTELMNGLMVDKDLIEARLKATPTKEQLEEQLKNRYTTARLSWEPRLFNPVLHRWAHRITNPVTLVWGDSDKIIPPSYRTVWESSLPNVKSSVVSKCGHLVHIEKTAELTALALAALGD